MTRPSHPLQLRASRRSTSQKSCLRESEHMLRYFVKVKYLSRSMITLQSSLTTDWARWKY